MSENDYFNPALYRVDPGIQARSSQINAPLDALGAAFDKLPDEDELLRDLVNYAVATGSANTLLLALPHAPSSYTDGMEVLFKAAYTNTGASSINVDSLGAKAITRKNGDALAADDILEYKIYSVRYNSTSGYFEMQGSEAGDGAATVAVTISDTEPSAPIAGMLWVDTS